MDKFDKRCARPGNYKTSLRNKDKWRERTDSWVRRFSLVKLSGVFKLAYVD